MQKNSSRWQILKSIDFYFITDSNLTGKGIFHDAKEAMKAGCKIIQYREKGESSKKEALQLKKLCEKHNAVFLINDDAKLAFDIDADGVHLGQKDMDFQSARKLLGNKIIGVTVHDVKEAVWAEKIGADYIGLSPVFATATKKDAGIPCGIPMMRKVRKATKLPIVAVGGITKENAYGVIKAGADSAAAISAVFPDVKKQVADFIRIIRKAKAP